MREIAAMEGDVAIGHTRYSTAGSSTIENAQPVLARFRDGHIALAHNGNLTNADGDAPRARGARVDLRVDDGFRSPRASNRALHRRDTPEGKLADALRDVEGAYSLVVDDRRHAARSARSARLAPARDGQARRVATSSRRRRCALDIVGATAIREVERGEIVAVDARACGRRSRSERKEREAACSSTCTSRGRTAASSADPSIARDAQLGRRLAREHPAPGAELVFSVPDSSNSAALGYAEESKLPFELALIRNHYVGRTFIQPTQAGRDAKVKVKYNAVREVLEGKSVVMVDDSIVRGTTTRGLVRWCAQPARARCTCA